MTAVGKPKGKPIAWTDAELDALAQVSQADLVAAATLWRTRAPQGLKDLLDAETEHVDI